jgi:hypothetical protein
LSRYFHFSGILPKKGFLIFFSDKIGPFVTFSIYSESALPGNVLFFDLWKIREMGILGSGIRFIHKKNATTFCFQEIFRNCIKFATILCCQIHIFFTQIRVNSRDFTKFHTFSRDMTSRKFTTNIHTFSRNLFFYRYGRQTTLKIASRGLFHKKSFIFPIRGCNMDCFE